MGVPSRDREECKPRSNPVCGPLDCFEEPVMGGAEPVIGRAFARPGSPDPTRRLAMTWRQWLPDQLVGIT
jgi:hypothetical protein